MPCGGAHQGEFADLAAFVPVEFDDPVLRYPPLAQMGAHAERHEERRALGAGQRDDRVGVEVVVVVMADQHRVHGRQRLQRHRSLMHPLRAEDPRRRAPAAPHRIGEHAVAVDLDQGAGMAVPVDRQFCRGGIGLRGRGQRNGSARPSAAAGADQFADQQPLLLAVQADRRRRVDVDERAVAVVRRALRHGMDLTGSGAQRRRCAVHSAQHPAGPQQRGRPEAEPQCRAQHAQAPRKFGGRFSTRATCASTTSWLPHALSNSSLCCGR